MGVGEGLQTLPYGDRALRQAQGERGEGWWVRGSRLRGNDGRARERRKVGYGGGTPVL